MPETDGWRPVWGSLMRAGRRFAGVALAALLGGAARGQPAAEPDGADAKGPDAKGPDAKGADVIAGGRMMTENGVFTLYTPNPTPANGLKWPGPYVAASRKRIPVGRASAGDDAYYRCRFAYTNWYLGTGHRLQTRATGRQGDSLLTVDSVASVLPGDAVTGPGLPPGETVERVASPTSVWLVRPTTAALAASPVLIASRPASYGANSGVLYDTGGPITVSAGVRPVFGDAAGPPLTLTFGRQPLATIPPGGVLWSDWAVFDARPGQAVEVDTTVYWPTGTYVFGGHVARADLGEDNTAFAATPGLLGGPADPSREARPAWRGSASRVVYGPANMICSTRAPAGAPQSLVIVGDSNATGTDDMRRFDPVSGTSVDLGDAQGFTGPWERAAGALHLPHMTYAQPGQRLADLLVDPQPLLSLIAGAPAYVVLALGVNDFGAAPSTSPGIGAVQAAWIRAVDRLQQGGRKVIAVTVGPRTVLNDGGRQTPAPGFGVGGPAQAFNAWLRQVGAPTYTQGRLIDLADIVMSARDSQVFRTDIAPFADWYGQVVGLSWWPGVGGADGVYAITATGGGCVAPPTVRATIVGGSIDTVRLTDAGRGCTGAPVVDLSVVPGFRNAALTLRVVPLQPGAHLHSGYDYTGATFSALGREVTGARLVDAQAAAAAAIQAQLGAILGR